MLVVEKTLHIRVNLTGEGTTAIAGYIKERLPNAEFIDDGDKAVEWKTTELAKEIRSGKTPGKLVHAYRERAGLTLVELARKVGTRYPNISAIENDRRVVGLAMAKKLGEALSVDYRKFIEA
jgi:plasmid maintenance system antidote protein VapI